jgi:hypothetical protein
MDMKRLKRLARDNGWEVEQTRNNHVAFVAPNGKRFVTSGTASDRRSMRNHIARLRKAGLPVPHRGK